MFIAILITMRVGWRANSSVAGGFATSSPAGLDVDLVSTHFPDAAGVSPGGEIRDAGGRLLGTALLTSPECDDVIGYSGPTNCLVMLDSQFNLLAVEILASGDTVEHMDLIKADDRFLQAFQRFGSPGFQWTDIDAVSAATLSSYSVIESVAKRIQLQAARVPQSVELSPPPASLKFSAKPDLGRLQQVLETARALAPQEQNPQQFAILDEDDGLIGSLVLTSPTADHLSGYQGPTASGIVFDLQGRVVGVYVDQTYENSPYANYLDDDYHFQRLYRGKTLEELAAMQPESLGIEGVSGATMTSMSVAEAIPLTAASMLQIAVDGNTTDGNTADKNSRAAAAGRLVEKTTLRTWSSYWPDVLTIVLVGIGVAYPFLPFCRHKQARVVYQMIVILCLGFLCGHLLSQALIAGWAISNVPWRTAPGLVVLAVAAFVAPVFSKRQPYCQHLCPLGSIQQLVKRRVPWQLRLGRRIKRILRSVPIILLGIVVIGITAGFNLNLAAVEAFDAFAFRVAGWSSLLIFLVGLVGSCFIPMAYCQYGCPTGSVLNFLKLRADSDRLGVRDAVAGCLLAIALLLIVV